MHLDASPAGRIDPSDLVQQTLLEAFEKREQFRGEGDAERGGLAADDPGAERGGCVSAQGRLKRDVSRERSLEQELDQSSARLGASGSPPKARRPASIAQRHEQAIRLADALARSAGNQREALILHYWQGCSLAEVGDRLDRTTSAPSPGS